MPDDTGNQGVDISPLHRELDRLKSQLCRCQHQGTCIACRGFEMLREQSQMVIAAASQPVLLQVAQEAAANDLMGRLSGMQETLQGKINEDGELQELMARFLERLQADLGGPEGMQQLADSLGFPSPGTAPEKPAYDDLPPDQRTKPNDEEKGS
jgi:hypothetical protein